MTADDEDIDGTDYPMLDRAHIFPFHIVLSFVPLLHYVSPPLASRLQKSLGSSTAPNFLLQHLPLLLSRSDSGLVLYLL